ncbi:hypothetical protein E4U42_005042 [Claviceps africana]|uniref:Uncharacterized protein n=1 Tax=Claviceps africana TaxID=83212 RepID=A0A8K0J476_9HYPO|nr:hypothetical protein E4U42_005042 [Claviceps africana]
MANSCSQWETPIVVSRQPFLNALSAAATATSTASAILVATSTDAATSSGAATSTASAAPTGAGIKTSSSSAAASTAEGAASENKKVVSLPDRTVLSIGLGAAAVGVIGITALIVCFWRRRRQTRSESYPMHNSSDCHCHGMPIAVSASELSANPICHAADQKSASGTTLPSGFYSPHVGSAAQLGAQHGVLYPPSAIQHEVFITREQSETRGGLEKISELDGSSAPSPLVTPSPRRINRN